MKYASYLMVLVVFSSCITHRPIQYLEGSFDSLAYKQVKWQEPVVQPGDILSIIVRSDNADATAPYNLGGGFSSAVSGSSLATGSKSGGGSTEGYLVDQDGMINMMGVGPLKVGQKTKKVIADELVAYFVAKDLLKNPVIDIRNLNFKVTVMGEVVQPGSFNVPTERINLLEALGQAGSFGPYARKEMVTVIREQNGQRSFARLDLHEPTVFNSPYYQLQQNDIVMVPANDKKDASNDQLTIRYITLGTSLVSVMAILINIFR
jgi:polysaccharide export outer membrane protein